MGSSDVQDNNVKNAVTPPVVDNSQSGAGKDLDLFKDPAMIAPIVTENAAQTETTESKANNPVQKHEVHVNNPMYHSSKRNEWPWGPGHPMEGQGDVLTDELSDEVRRQLRKKVALYLEENPSVKEPQDLFNRIAKEEGVGILRKVLKSFGDRPTLPKEEPITYSKAQEILMSENKDAPGNAMLPHLLGSFGGDSQQSYRHLDTGLMIVKYNDIKDFDNDIIECGKQKPIDNKLEGITGTCYKSLASVVEIVPQNEKPYYKIVTSDRFGVRVNNINEDDYKDLVSDNDDLAKSKGLKTSQEIYNREQLTTKILSEYTPARTFLSDMGKAVKDTLISQCKNDKLFGIIPVPGIWGGRKDTLKRAMKTAAFTFSSKNGVIVEEDLHRPHRKYVTVNGKPNSETFINLGNDCSVKLDKFGEIVPDKIYKLLNDGKRQEIDISGDMFRLPLSKAGPLVKALLTPETKTGSWKDAFNLNIFDNNHSQARKAAGQVMDAYNKLEVIVCKNRHNSKDNKEVDENVKSSVCHKNKGAVTKEIELSFMAKGKTHGLHLSGGEKIFSNLAAGTVVTGAVAGSVVTGAVVGAVGIGVAAAAGVATLAGASYAAAKDDKPSSSPKGNKVDTVFKVKQGVVKQ